MPIKQDTSTPTLTRKRKPLAQPSINMRSSAYTVKGQGVGSCYEEQVGLVKNLEGFTVYENSPKKCDIAHYHTVDLNHYFEIILRKNKTVHVGYVHFLPDTVDDSLKLPRIARWAFYKYLLTFYNSMDYLVTVNPMIIEKIKEYGIYKPTVLCIPNFVSEKRFFPQDAETIRATRRKYNMPEDGFIALGVGQLQTRKGVLDFVKTAELLPEVTFVWAGGFSFGKFTDGYAEIKAITENPPPNVKFLGMVEREDMNSIYNSADVMFLPSYDELFPMAILEALCCRKPCLLRDIDIYRDILFNSYMAGDGPTSFATALESLRDDEAVREEYSQKAWECHKIYSEENIARMWENFYTKALEKARTRKDKRVK